ncbi:glycosyltransferase family 4 protein [Ornatilinea apprima]|uniref:glycosyltransferase family 4 protein n=1 Tax=Ornatilinea apprima TaxID=1134406 RepID=UPI0009467F17|nr:glycosyltransferase family 4 protein [Ornatilinea apprima]
MKILLANYRYFVSSGPERYLFNISEILEKRGHTVIPFSIRYSKNQNSSYSKYFLDPIGTEDQVYFREHSNQLSTNFRAMKRLFFDPEVERRTTLLIEESQPDVAYILKYLRKISPAILVALKKKKIPIVVRLSDYEMACPGLHFLRDDKPCELCLKKSRWQSVIHKCVQNSTFLSLMNFSATQFHSLMGYFNLVDTFVVTNHFMKNKMIEAGIDESRLKIIPTYTKPVTHEYIKKEELIICYVGRLDRPKGVHILIEALNIIRQDHPDHLPVCYIAGEGTPEYTNLLKLSAEKYGLQDHVLFLGQISKSEINKLMQSSICTIIPSLWYENLPNSLLESYANGTPVIAANIGSLPEFVMQNETGLLFNPADSKDLALKILSIMKFDRQKFSKNCISYTNKNSEELHVLQLEELFLSLLTS